MQGARCRVQGAGCKVQGAGFRVQGARRHTLEVESMKAPKPSRDASEHAMGASGGAALSHNCTGPAHTTPHR